MAHISLREIEREFGPLREIENLDLSNRGLTSLPILLGELARLRTLNLSENHLTILPPQVGKLASLQSLNLSGNQLISLPSEIGELSQLENLDLSNNRLITVTEEIGKLCCLRKLVLNTNSLSHVPLELGGVGGLKELDLGSNHLTVVPAALLSLLNLEILVLVRNKLTRIPAELGKLTNLQVLDLDSNILTGVPGEIGNLTNLKMLDIRRNRLASVPEELGRLQNLTELYLNRNELSSLPDSLGRLEKLEYFYLDGNRLTSLPPSFGNLTRLKVLSFDDNAGLRSPPREIIQQGLEAILLYLRGLTPASATRQYVSKLLVVGQGYTGKTELLRALRGLEFRPQSDTTHGLDVQTLELSHPHLEGVTMSLNTWDFAGQDIEHATHQFYLTDRSLFLLVWNARQDYEQGRLLYWLDSITALAPDSPILLVATHVEDGRKPGLPLEEIRGKYARIVGSFAVSNRDRTGIDELELAIAEQAATLPLMGQLWPATWLAAANTIRGRSDMHCSYESVLELIQEHDLDLEGAEVLIKWLHDLGELLHFADNAELQDLVVLKPQWVRQYISRVLECETVGQNQGLFTKKDMKSLWPDIEPYMREHLLRFMEQYDLSYRTLHDEEVSLVVERVPYEEPRYPALWQSKAGPDVREVSLLYRLGSVPAGIPTWFIARSHRFSTHTHWRTGAIFVQEREVNEWSHWALVRADPHERYVQLTVRGPEPHNFMALLRDGLELTLQRFPGLRCEVKVPCPCGGSDGQGCRHEFDLEILKGRSKSTIECPVSEIDVPLSKLLFGLDWRRQADVLARLEAMESAQTNPSIDDVKAIVNVAALAQRQFLNDFKREQQSEASRCPNVFTLRPLDTNTWRKSFVGQKLELHLCCQAPGEWHLTERGGRYEIPDPAHWLKRLGPHTKRLIPLLRVAASLGGPLIHLAGSDLDVIFKANFEMTKELVKLLPNINDDEGPKLVGKIDESHFASRVDGAQLRVLRALLEELDASRHWGGLNYITTPEGHGLWLCDKHMEDYRF